MFKMEVFPLLRDYQIDVWNKLGHKCMSCHKAIVVITGGHIVFMITYIYIYIYIYTYHFPAFNAMNNG